MKKITLLFMCFFAVAMLQAQTEKSVWSKAKEEQVPMRPHNERTIIPAKYEVWKLDFQALKNQLDKAPMETSSTSAPVMITLPLPDGKEVSFNVMESPVAHPALMAKYKSFKTFSGFGGRNKEYAGRFDYTIDGFRASIDTPEGEIYIDPYASDMQNYYIIYYTRGYQRHGQNEPFRCGVVDGGGHTHTIPNEVSNESYRSVAGSIVKIRKFRLAMAATAEFTAKTGGTVPKALARMVALVNRTNKVTMKESGYRFELIANTDTLIWTNPANDPFPKPTEGKVVVGQSHGGILQRVSLSAFDIGHTMTVPCTDGVGGVAGGRVCIPQNKGAGMTCDAGSVDQVAVNTMAHEMGGHQFSGSHTMSNCPGAEDQVGSSSAIEPGSGSTIMSYDGSCGVDNVTGIYWKTEGFYSIGTLGQQRAHMKSNTCGVDEEINNHYPDLVINNQQKGLFVPISTAFELSATATDSDGDNLKYSWEQSDQGANMPLGRQNIQSNSFRVFDPVSTGVRTFPRLASIIKNVETKDELYPDTTRKYTFVCAVRDNNVLGAGVVLDTVVFRTTHLAGPFALTFPNVAADTASAGDYMKVKWNVANTDGTLVNCKQVNILLSTDGGYTYPITLLKNTANDGEEGVILPQGTTSSSARIRINAVDNIFFDISNRDFKIKENTKTGYTIALNTTVQKICLPETAVLNIQSVALGTYDKTIQLSVNGLPQGAVAKFDSDTLKPNQNTRLVLDTKNVTFQGDITITLRAIAGTDTIYRTTIIKTVSADFSAMAVNLPAVGATAVSPLPTFKWTASPNAETYDIEIATNPSFAAGTVVYTASNLKSTDLFTPVSLTENTLYYWRLRAKNNCTMGDWIVPSPFHTLVQACNDYKQTKTFNISASQASTITGEIDITDAGTISDVNVSSFKGTHGNFGDLEVRLISPSGKASLLSDKKCAFSGGTTLNLRYDDEALQANKCDKLLNLGLSYRPDSPLNIFDGEDTKGKWKFEIKDIVPGEGGALQEWAVRFCSSRAVTAPSIIKNDTLKVRPNNGRFLSDTVLVATDDKATTQQLTYTLVALPKFGKIERWAGGILAVGTTFSQAEINQKHTIRYVNTDNSAKNDYFLFVLTDGEGGFAGTLRYNILIDDKAPISSVQDPTLAQAVKVYPNPTQNILNVSIFQNTLQTTKLQLFSVNGQQVLERVMKEGEETAQLETSNLPEGIYLLKISNATGFATKRVVIQR